MSAPGRIFHRSFPQDGGKKIIKTPRHSYSLLPAKSVFRIYNPFSRNQGRRAHSEIRDKLPFVPSPFPPNFFSPRNGHFLRTYLARISQDPGRYRYSGNDKPPTDCREHPLEQHGIPGGHSAAATLFVCNAATRFSALNHFLSYPRLHADQKAGRSRSP